MTETNINTKGAFGLNMQIEPIPEINSISDLPKITSFILTLSHFHVIARSVSDEAISR